jgi:hypothetical protein
MKICYNWKFEGNLNTHVPLYGRNNIGLTDIIPWISNHGQLEHYMFMHM